MVANCLLFTGARPGAALCAVVEAFILNAVLVIASRLLGSRLQGILDLR